jgi:chaperonin GroES
VRSHRGTLRIEVSPDVDGEVDLHRGATDPGTGKAEVACERRLFDEVRLDEVEILPVDGHLVDAPDTCLSGGHHPDTMALDVVGVPVDAVVVVDHERVGVLVGQQPGELLRCLRGIGRPERPRCLVRRIAGHAGVPVVEEVQGVHAQCGRRGVGLGPAMSSEVRTRARWEAQLSAGRDDDDDAMSTFDQEADGPAAEDRFVVGVRVQERDGRHPPKVVVAPTGTSRRGRPVPLCRMNDAVQPEPTTTRPGGGNPMGRNDRMPVRMLNDRLLVKLDSADEERRSSGGILIPATAQLGRRLAWAEVRAAGPNVRAVQEGDHVLFNPEEVYEVEVRGETFVILRERDIHALAAERLEEGHTGLYL